MRDPDPLSRNTEHGTRNTNESRAPRYGVVARASAAGLLFPLSIVAGYLLGKWTAAALGLPPWVAFVGAVLGVAAGFWNLYRLLRGLETEGRSR